MSFNNSNSEVLNRVFSNSSLKAFLKGELPSSYVTSIERYIKNENGTNLQKISEIYKYLWDNHRNEYCYKNSLLNNLLVHSKEHNLKTTTALTEIVVSKSKPDFILINGKSIVYEIKTGLDNFERLQGQLTDYYKAFDNVCVITDEKNIKKLELFLRDDKYTGICILQDSAELKTIKPCKPLRTKLDSEIMFKILRKYEFENIIKQVYGALPDVSQFKYYAACYELIKKMQIEEFFVLFKSELKKRALIIEEKFLTIPNELKMLAYFSQMKRKDYTKLDTFLNSPYILK